MGYFGTVVWAALRAHAEWGAANTRAIPISVPHRTELFPSHTLADPAIHGRLTRDIPARRTGRPEEIGPLAVYLASPGSEFMTGQTIFLDGGQTVA